MLTTLGQNRVRGVRLFTAALTLSGLLLAPGVAMGDNKSWNNPNGGDWNTPGDWTPAGVPLSADDVFIGNIAGVENDFVHLDINDTVASLTITDGMRLITDGFNLVVQGEALLSGENFVNNVVYRSSISVNGDGVGNDADIDTLTLINDSSFSMSENAVVEIDLVATVAGGCAIRGSGTMNLRGNATPSLRIDGILDPTVEGLVINQLGTGLIDLDGLTGNSVISIANSKIDGTDEDDLTINGTALADSFSGEIDITSGGFLDMNLTNGWVADASSIIRIFGDSVHPKTTIISGGDFDFAGFLRVAGGTATGDIEANTTIQPAAEIEVALDDVLIFSGETEVLGGLFALEEGARVRFDGDTTVDGGTFNTFGPSTPDGYVEFNGSTLWTGDIMIDGLVRQDGPARTGLSTTVTGGVFDLDGTSGFTGNWDLDAPLILNVDAIDTTVSNRYDGTLDLGNAFQSRLTVNLTDPSDRWELGGTCNLSGNAAFNLNRITGSSPVAITGEVNLTNSKAGITSDAHFFEPSSLNFAAAGSELTMGGVSQFDGNMTITGAGLLINATAGDMTLEDGLDLGAARVRNLGRLTMGDEEVALVNTAAFENGVNATFAVDVGCIGGSPMVDMLVVNGVATLAGTLELSHLATFQAEPGHSVAVIHANAFVGVLPYFNSPAGWNWAVSYDVPNADVIVTLNGAPAQATLGAASRRLHNTDTYDLHMNIGGGVLDPRQNGTQPQTVFTYNLPPIDPGCGGVSIVNGTCLGTSVECNKLVIDMTFDKNACVEVTVGGDSVYILTHEGNVDNNAAVNILDLQQIKNRLITFVDETNFIYDITVSGGAINILDLQAAKNNLFVPAGCN